MRQLCMIALCAVLTLALPLVGKGELSPQHEVIVYVSPHGNDAWSGQFPQANAEKNDGPLRTLAQARQTIHQAKQSQPNCNYTVYLRGGNYTLDQTLVLEPRDGSPEGYLTTFAAYESERVSIGSGLAIQGWRRPTEEEKLALAPQAREHVWVCSELPVHPATGKPWLFKTLFERERPLPRARSRGFAPLGEYSYHDGPRDRLQYPLNTFKARDNATDIEILIRPMHAWTMNILPVQSVDEVNGVVTPQINATYPMMRLDEQIDSTGQSCWIENAIEDLKFPGNWALNTRQGKLYLWPTDENGAAPSGICVPTLTELIRLEGNFNEKGLIEEPVRNIALKGLTFIHTERHTWDASYRGFQHDWSAVDLADAAVRLRGARGCAVEGCRITGGGSSGIRLDLYAQDNRIEGNELSGLGGHGIELCGYGPGTVNVNKNNIISNNWIHHIGQLYWHAFAIYLAQSEGNIVSRNLIHNIPFVGITLSGSRDMNKFNPRYGEGWNCVRWDDFTPEQLKHWEETYAAGKEPWKEFYPYLHTRNNRIEGNDISRCIEKMGDGNAIYLSGAGAGNIIRRNYIHHLLSAGHQTALRPDDLQMGTLFEENIIYQCVWGAVQHKHVNQYLNNIFACILPTNTRGNTWRDWAYFSALRGPVQGTVLKRNIFYSPQAPTVFYTDTAQVGMYPPEHPFTARMEEIECDQNLFYTAQDPRWSQDFLKQTQQRGIDQHSISADPMFADLKGEDFSLAPQSPALSQLGFTPIDQTQIGLEPQWRAAVLGDKILTTTISPSTGELPQGIHWKTTLSCNQPGAQIHYTLDGSEPTTASTIYQSPIPVDATLLIRAKAFKDGWLDYREAAAFYLDRYSLKDDFENIQVGARPFLPTIFSDTGGEVFVTDAAPAQGKHCLRIAEHGGLKHSFNPHFYYTPLAGTGCMTLDFDLKADHQTILTHQWRQFDKQGLLIGPQLTLEAGNLKIGPAQSYSIPEAAWFHVSIRAWVGGPKHAQYEVTLSNPQTAPKTYHAQFDEKILSINWIGFSSDSTGNAEFYLDGFTLNISAEAAPSKTMER